VTIFRFNIELGDDEATKAKIFATNINNMDKTNVATEAFLERS
jgi:hypothetical protein